MTMYFIYLIKNKINNKCYVGFTNRIKKRWKEHILLAESGEGFKLHSAIRKYGKDNFSFEVIFSSNNREETLIYKEPYFIKLYDSFKNGYNGCEGGYNVNTEEMKLKASERMKINNPMKVLRTNKGSFIKGHKPVITEERNKKISESKKGSKNPNYKKSSVSAHLNVKISCEKCGYITSKSNMVRWHIPKCI